jgi:hypothetical protein
LTSITTVFFERAQAFALRLDLRRFAAVNGAIILLLGAFGVLHIVFEPRLGIFDLNGERNVPATCSAALWVCVAVIAMLLGRAERGRAARTWSALSVPVLFVGADEFGEIHERLERITGIDWQIIYAPVGLVAVILWLLVGRRLSELGSGFRLFVTGTACGIASQAFEAFEYDAHDRRVGAFNELMVSEELLEMCAAVLVGLALLAALHMVSRDARA